MLQFIQKGANLPAKGVFLSGGLNKSFDPRFKLAIFIQIAGRVFKDLKDEAVEITAFGRFCVFRYKLLVKMQKIGNKSPCGWTL